MVVEKGVRPADADDLEAMAAVLVAAFPDASPVRLRAWAKGALRHGVAVVGADERGLVAVAVAGARWRGCALSVQWRTGNLVDGGWPRSRGVRGERLGRLQADRAVWPEGWDAEVASRAARRRWADTDPRLARLWALAHALPPSSASNRSPNALVDPASELSPLLDDMGNLLEGLSTALTHAGFRRLDVRARASTLAGHLVAVEWLHGQVGRDVVASRLLALPWRQAGVGPGRRLSRHRVVRGLRQVTPGRVPELLLMAVEEAVGVLRTGRATSGRTQGANRFEPTWHHFEAARHRGIRRLLRLVPAELATTTFVDIGCGKGRALLVASGLPFHRLVGLEIDPSLVDTARTLNADHRVEVIVGDATAWEVEDDVGVVYFSTPSARPGSPRWWIRSSPVCADGLALWSCCC